MGGDFDRDALLNGLNNERVKQESVSAYWVGAVAENSGYKVYLFFERWVYNMSPLPDMYELNAMMTGVANMAERMQNQAQELNKIISLPQNLP